MGIDKISSVNGFTCQSADSIANQLMDNSYNAEAMDAVLAAEWDMSEEDRARKERLDELNKYRISALATYPPEECALIIDGVGFFAKGDIHAIKAKAKQGKTAALSLCISAILSGSWGRLKGGLENPKVLFIDTEQKPQDTQVVYNRILQMAGMPLEDCYERFQAFSLRPFSPQERLAAVKDIMKAFQPDIAFYDGVVDLMGNFNEVEDSQKIINELMHMSTKDFCGVETAIVCVLHTNKSSEDHNMRGHIGTMLSQKAGNVFETEKKNGVFTVRCTESRHKEVPEWSFMYDAEGNIVDADERLAVLKAERHQHLQEMRAQKTADTHAERQETVAEIIRQSGGKIHRYTLRKMLKEKLSLSDSSLDNLFKKLIEEEFVIQNDSKEIALKM